MSTVESTIATRAALSDVLGAPGGAYAVLHLLRREALWSMLRENPMLITPQDPWRETRWNQRTQALPTLTLRVGRPRPTRFAPDRVVVPA